MAHPFAVSGAGDPGAAAERPGDEDGLSDLLGPLLAGARARGVADAFEMLDLAAVLVDGTGRVLHAGSRAQRALSPVVRIVEDHLVGADAAANDALQSLMSGAFGGPGGADARCGVSLLDASGHVRLSIRAIRLPQALCDAPQLLKAVLIVTELTV